MYYFCEEDMMLKKLRPRFLTMAFSIFSVLILILTACGASGTPSPSGNAGKPVKGGTFTDDLYEDVDSLIPNGITETYAFLVIKPFGPRSSTVTQMAIFIPAWRQKSQLRRMATSLPI